MHQYPSDISREEYELIREELEGAKKKTRPSAANYPNLLCCPAVGLWSVYLAGLTNSAGFGKIVSANSLFLLRSLLLRSLLSLLEDFKQALMLNDFKCSWPYLLRYLEDGRLEPSNNRAERSIKPFVIGRKNFLFANTSLAWAPSEVIYSLIETAKESGLDPFHYLTWVLETAPTLNRTVDGWAGPLLPENAPKSCETT